MKISKNPFFAGICFADCLLKPFGRISVSRVGSDRRLVLPQLCCRSFRVYQPDMSASFAGKATGHSTKPESWQVSGYVRLFALSVRRGGAQRLRFGNTEQQACPPRMLRNAVSSLPSKNSGFCELLGC
jgi:hypothetical protein